MSDSADSKKQILKATGILGSAQLFVIVVGILRVKILAVLLGAVGVGIAGLYQNTLDLIRAATGLGLRTSAVRDIAQSAGSGSEEEVSATILVLRRWVWFTGLAGMAVALLFSRQLSSLAFGTPDYAWGIAVLSIIILMTSVSDGQGALLQGLRRIGDMARAKVGSAVLGLVGAAVIYWVWGLQGIVPALMFTALVALGWNWYYSRKVRPAPVRMPAREVFAQGKSMATQGLYLSVSGIAGIALLYIIRAYVARQDGLASVGHFVAAWSISYMYLSAIFGAMSGDYYPRLSAVQEEPVQMARLVNEQAEIALLITTPVIIFMITFIHLVVRVFYSRDFGPTAQILDWQLAGDFFKVLAWPLGFILLARGRSGIFLLTELSGYLIYFLAVYVLWPAFGLQSTGIGFLIAFFLVAVLSAWITYRLTGFIYSRRVWGCIGVFAPLVLAAFCAQKYLAAPFNLLAGTAAGAVAAAYAYKHLRPLIPLDKILNKILKKAGLGRK